MTIGPKEERLCLVQPANADESASSTTGTSQESGQDSLLLQISENLERIVHLQMEVIETAREGNSLLLALIESMAEGGDSEEFHMPKPL